MRIYVTREIDNGRLSLWRYKPFLRTGPSFGNFKAIRTWRYLGKSENVVIASENPGWHGGPANEFLLELVAKSLGNGKENWGKIAEIEIRPKRIYRIKYTVSTAK